MKRWNFLTADSSTNVSCNWLPSSAFEIFVSLSVFFMFLGWMLCGGCLSVYYNNNSMWDSLISVRLNVEHARLFFISRIPYARICWRMRFMFSLFFYLIRWTQPSKKRKTLEIMQTTGVHGIWYILHSLRQFFFLIKSFIWARYDIVACSFEMVFVQFIESSRNEPNDRPSFILSELQTTNFFKEFDSFLSMLNKGTALIQNRCYSNQFNTCQK